MTALQPSSNPLTYPVNKDLQYLISQDTAWSILRNEGEEKGPKHHHLTEKPVIPIDQIGLAWFIFPS